MSRSIKKLPYVDEKLRKKIDSLRKLGKKKTIKIWCRSSTITEEMIGFFFSIHNGKIFFTREVTSEMVGKKFGEFSPTRKLGKHGKAGKH